MATRKRSSKARTARKTKPEKAGTRVRKARKKICADPIGHLDRMMTKIAKIVRRAKPVVDVEIEDVP